MTSAWLGCSSGPGCWWMLVLQYGGIARIDNIPWCIAYLLRIALSQKYEIKNNQ
jgi:hypothetical protein